MKREWLIKVGLGIGLLKHKIVESTPIPPPEIPDGALQFEDSENYLQFEGSEEYLLFETI